MKMDFIKEYYEQDNCGTAYPIYFVIRDIKWIPSYWATQGDKFLLIYDGESLYEADTLTELFEKIKNDAENFDYDLDFPEDFDFNHPDQFEIDNFTENNKYVTGIFAQTKEYENKNMFLLKSEAEEHLKLNHYHYSKDAFVYCEHAWRAPRQEKFFQELKEAQNVK